MGIKNYLIRGISGSGKTSVAEELQRRGYHVIHGDRELAYHGDAATGEPVNPPEPSRTGEPIPVWRHRTWIWKVETVRMLAASESHDRTFFCGDARNLDQLIDLFDKVFVLEVDLDTLKTRVAGRGDDEFGGKPDEWGLIAKLHSTREDLPKLALPIDAVRPISIVVDDILLHCAALDDDRPEGVLLG